ncbi:hypothetical protein DOY81_014805 [Sarcophaga bullata]|nr:hypothetical protein DOY81_014805 [Sarcophaga bullata]
MENFTTTIGTVERNINDMLAYQYHSRNREARDFALVMDNNTYIQTFSVCQIIVIIITCSVQVFFVRKLFNVKDSSRSRI